MKSYCGICGLSVNGGLVKEEQAFEDALARDATNRIQNYYATENFSYQKNSMMILPFLFK